MSVIYSGTVASYEETDEGLKIVLDIFGQSFQKCFLINDITQYPDTYIEEMIEKHQVGIEISVVCEFLSSESQPYPAKWVCPVLEDSYYISGEDPV